MWLSLLWFHGGSGRCLSRCHPSGGPARSLKVSGSRVLASFGIGEVHPEADFIVKRCALASGLISHIPECRDAPECSSTHGGDTASAPSPAPAPRSHLRDTLPPGTDTFQGLFLASHPPGWTTRVPPSPSRSGCPSPRAGTDGVCPDLKSILDFPARPQGPGGGRAAPQHGTEGALTAPRASPAGGAALPAPTALPRTLPGPAGLVLLCKSGHGTGVAAVSGSGVRVVALRGVSLLEGGRSWAVPSKGAGVLF